MTGVQTFSIELKESYNFFYVFSLPDETNLNSGCSGGLEDQRCPLVAGSLGPYGAFLHNGSEYTGDYAEKMSIQVSLSAFHR